ncbi:MAG: alpha/beta fold hydrolase [Candidatus Hodarchaeales archaeon]|jgi:pimeloyl-ACP methyl ester carboxylesterase
MNVRHNSINSVQKKEIIHNQINWNYIVQGKGDKTILMLPGGLRAPVFGGFFTEKISTHFKIISPSYPSIWDLKALIQGINRILDQEKVKRVHLFGSSFGGLMCQAFMVYSPHKVDRIIIGNTGTVQSDPRFKKRMQRGLFLINILPTFLVRRLMIRAFTRIVPKNTPNYMDVVRLIRNHIQTKQLDKQDVICHFKSLIFFQTELKLTHEVGKSFQDKLLIIYSDEDSGVDTNALKNLKGMYPEAKYHQFVNGGHMPMIIFPEEYFNLVIDFLKK